MNKKRMKEICNIFLYAGGGNVTDERFETMFEYYWKEIKEMGK